MLSVLPVLVLTFLFSTSLAPQEGGPPAGLPSQGEDVAVLSAFSPASGGEVFLDQEPPRRPLQLEDYYRLKSVGSPRISPDGRWVTYTVSTPEEETDDSGTETWLVQADAGGKPARVLHRGEDVTNPRWTEDGRLRVTQRDTAWLMDPARPEASGARDDRRAPEGVLSPDGQWRAVVRDLPGTSLAGMEPRAVTGAPEPGRSEATSRAGGLEVAREPSAPPTLTDFQRRHEERFRGHALDWYPFLQDGRPFPIPDPRARPEAEIFLEPVNGSGEARQLTQLGMRPSNLSWSPDGGTLLFSADESVRDELAYSRTDLFLVTPEGRLTRLTDDGYVYSSPAFSPDGRWISYVRSFGLDMIIDGRLDHGGPRDLYLLPVVGGETAKPITTERGGAGPTAVGGKAVKPRGLDEAFSMAAAAEAVNLTADWDLDPGTPMWSPDSRYLSFTAGIGGAVHLFRIPASGGGVEQITAGERRISGLDLDPAFRRMTYTVGDFDRPPEVWVADVDGSNERCLTDVHHDFLAEIEVATHPSERIVWNSYDGTPIEGFLLFPHGYDPQGGPYPLIIMNHGGPHSASGYGFNFKNRLFTAHGYFVFLPNFRSSTGYGTDFKWGTWGAWGSNDGEDVLSGVDHLVAHYPIDGNRVGSTGHSYGGILTNWLITRYPDRFRAAVSGAGESNWTSNFALSDIARTKETEFFGRPWEPRAREVMIRQSAYLNSEGVQAATLFVHGEVDYRVPLSGAIQLYTSLKKQGVPAKLLIYEGQPHGIRGHWNNVHRAMHELAWWEEYLKPHPTDHTGTARGR
ncbi:MAG: S9 family peptidase [Longimicrobiales bacterium]